MNRIVESLRALDGARIPGGCDQCDAYQAVTSPRGDPRIAAITVFHDDNCPTLARSAE